MKRRAVAARIAMKAVAQFTDMAGTKQVLASLGQKKKRTASHSDMRFTEPWSIAVGTHITRVDAGSVANAVNSNDGRSMLRCRTGQGIRDPPQSHHVTGVERRHHEHHGEVSRGGTDGGAAMMNAATETYSGNVTWK